jgi:hypothetical protein
VKEQREKWKAQQPVLDATKYVFLDETWASTNMCRTHGRCPQGQRLVMSVPHGHWKTTTFVVALRTSGLIAPTVVDGPMTGGAQKRTIPELEEYLGEVLDCFSPEECQNYFVSCGYTSARSTRESL